MKFSTLALLAGTAAAAPVADIEKRAVNDAQILNYALTLEHLEDTFYRGGLAQFSEADFAKAGFDSFFYKNLQEVSRDETTHVSFLTGALQAAGYKAVAACSYKFPYTDPKSFVALASVLEGVGVSAYLGAAASIADKTYLTAAGSILTVEARHTSYLRANMMPGQSPFAQPFDVPLDFDEVYSLAGQFITSCPSSNPPLPVKAFPVLSVAAGTALPAPAGRVIQVNSAKTLSGNVYAAFITVTGPIFVTTTSKNYGNAFDITVPSGIAGQSYVVLTSSKDSVTDSNILAGPAIVPVLASYLAPN